MFKYKINLLFLTLCFGNILSTNINQDNNKKRKREDNNLENKTNKKPKIYGYSDSKIKEVIKKYVKNKTNFLHDNYFNGDDQIWLYQAIKENNKDEINEIILNFKIDDNPIIVALKDNNAEAVELFIKFIGLNSLDEYFDKLLPNHYFSDDQNRKKLYEAIKNKNSLKVIDILWEDKNKPIELALKEDNIKALELLISFLDDEERWGERFFSNYEMLKDIFFNAIQNNRLDIVNILLNLDTYLPLQFTKGDPLLFACKVGNLKVVELLHNNLEDDENTYYSDYKNYGKNTPLIVAGKNGHLEIIKYFIETEECYKLKEITEILRKCPNNIYEYLLQILEEEFNENPDKVFKSILQAESSFELIEYFLKKGIIITSQTLVDYLKTPFYISYLETVEFLIENGAEITPKALITASRYGHSKVIKYFLHINKAFSSEELTKSLEANYNWKKPNKKIITYLIEKGADIGKLTLRTFNGTQINNIISIEQSIFNINPIEKNRIDNLSLNDLMWLIKRVLYQLENNSDKDSEQDLIYALLPEDYKTLINIFRNLQSGTINLDGIKKILESTLAKQYPELQNNITASKLLYRSLKYIYSICSINKECDLASVATNIFLMSDINLKKSFA